MEGTVKLVSGTLVIPTAAAACSYFAIRLAEQISCRLVELLIEQALSVVLCLVELVVSLLDGFFTNSLIPQ